MVLSAQDFVWQNHRQAPARAVHASIKIPVDRSQAAGEQCAGLLLLPVRICRIPDDCIDKNRYPLFMARAVLQELIESLQLTTGSAKP